MGSVFGWVFGIMSLGHRVGVYFPGLQFNLWGSYTGALLTNVAVAWVASGLTLALLDWRQDATMAAVGTVKPPTPSP